MNTIRCQCGRLLAFQPEHVGRLLKCPACGSVTRAALPQPATSPDSSGLALEQEGRAETPAGGPPAASQSTYSVAPPITPPTAPAMPTRLGPAKAPKVRKRRKSPPFWPTMARAPLYPMMGKSALVWVGGTLVFTGMHYVFYYVKKFPFLGDIAAIFIDLVLTGLVIGYLLNAIASTADGETGAPDWPEWKGVNSALLPLLNLLPFVFVWVMGMVSYRYLPEAVKAVMENPIFKVGVAAAGAICLPMALLFVALADSMEGLNPGPVVRAIRAVPMRYGFVCLLAFTAGTAYAFLGKWMPLSGMPPLGFAIRFAIEVYVLLLLSRIIGLLYHTSRKQLEWMEDLFDR